MKFPSPPSAEAVIAVSGVSRHFGSKAALNDVSVFVPRGSVLGLVGENGAGKTTLIKHLLGAFKAQTGSVRVFGLDPVLDPVGVLGRVGYLSERRDLPGWMRVDEFMRYTQAFYPGWDESYAGQLLEQFQLDPAQKIKTLSQGQQAKIGLLTSLAYRPELLILDEPSSGLDPRGSPGHFGGHHSHRGRGRPDRSVLVASARRSRTGGRPRRHAPARTRGVERTD
jgi:ABC-2 type transport system ATP-binding protein